MTCSRACQNLKNSALDHVIEAVFQDLIQDTACPGKKIILKITEFQYEYIFRYQMFQTEDIIERTSCAFENAKVRTPVMQGPIRF